MLLAIDGSPASYAALGAACSMAAEYGGTISARYVLAMEPHVRGRHILWMPEIDADKRREAFAVVRNAEDTAAKLYGIKLHAQVLNGDPVDELLEAARCIAADTIVIGNRGQSAFSTLMLGSVAQGVTQRSVLPVLVVHGAPSTGIVDGQLLQAAKSR